MTPITEVHLIDRYKQLVSEMTFADDYHCEFNLEWVLNRGWKVVLVEDCNHFCPSEIDRIVPTLQSAGYRDCVAVATEPLDPFPSCFQLTMTKDDLREFNAECGPFRFTITEETRSWAICCNEFYNLFAGEQSLVEAMLGVSIEGGRKAFLAFAEPLSGGDPEYPMLKVAARYAAL